MKPSALAIAAVSLLVSGAATFLIIRALGIGGPELAFIVGSIGGTQVGAIMHRRQPGALPTTAAKAGLGVALAISAITLGMLLHLAARPFTFVEISVPMAAVGAFVFPFVLFNTLWKTLPSKS